MTDTIEYIDKAPRARVRASRLLPVLGALIALGPLSVDMYLPALPAIQSDLGTTPVLVQFTLAGVMAGMGIGQLVVGPLADAVGRRGPLLAGLVLYVLASLLCAVAPSFTVIAAARLAQGFAVSTAGVTATAMIRDRYAGSALARVLSRLLIIPLVAPVIAPTIGSAVLRWAPWRAVFLLLALIGAAIYAWSLRTVPETLLPARRRSARPAHVVGTYRLLFRDRHFVAHAVVVGATMGALIAYVSGASFVLQGRYGLDEQRFGLVFGAGGISLIIASQLNAALLRRYSPGWILNRAVPIGIAAAGWLVLAATTGLGGLLGLLGPLWLMLATIGITFPNAPAAAMTRHGAHAGSAAALVGAVQFAGGTAAAPLVGALGNTATAIAVVSAAGMVIAQLALVAARPRGSASA